jgi:Purple acid Phosphatase, N-terminal domain
MKLLYSVLLTLYTLQAQMVIPPTNPLAPRRTTGVINPGGSPGAPFGPSPTATPNYYVAPFGDDGNDGRSMQTAWQTLKYATSHLSPGDVLCVANGIWSNQPFKISAPSAGATEPVTIEACPGASPIITGAAQYAVIGAIYGPTIVDGLRFEGFTNINDVLDIWANNTTVRNTTFKNVPFQFIRIMGADGTTVETSYFEGNGQPPNEGLGDAIYAGSATHVLVQYNMAKHSGHYFFDAQALPSGANASKIVVQDNTVHSEWGGGIANGAAAQQLLYQNNRLTHIGEGDNYIKANIEITGPMAIARNNIMTAQAGWYSNNGLDIDAEDNVGPEDALHNRVYGNVFYKLDGEPFFMSQRWERDLADNKFANNILYANQVASTEFSSSKTNYVGIETYHSYQKCPAQYCSNYVWTVFPNYNYFLNNLILHADSMGDHPGESGLFTYTGNTYMAGWTFRNFSDSLTQIQSKYPQSFSGNIEKNPEFVDADGGDFTLSSNSPAIAAGTHMAHTTGQGLLTASVPVDDPYWFTDGYGLIPGDLVKIGENPAVRITAVDYTGSWLTVSNPVIFTTGTTVDVAGFQGSAPDMGAIAYSPNTPFITNVTNTVVNATTATISWVTSAQGTCQVEFGVTDAREQRSMPTQVANGGCNVEIMGLWPNTVYHYAAITVDSQLGGRTISADATFQTPAVPGPIISNVAATAQTTTSAVISWDTDVPTDSRVFYTSPDQKYNWTSGLANSAAGVDSGAVLHHVVRLTGLLPNTHYHYRVQSSDKAAWQTSYSDDADFVTAATASNGPVISNIQISPSVGRDGWHSAPAGEQGFAPSGFTCCGYDYARVTFTWNTSTPTTNNKVFLIPLVGGGYFTPAELDAGTAWSVSGNPSATRTPSLTIYQLAPGTTYVYEVESTDAAGHTTRSANLEFTTPAIPGGVIH